jgi:hypothetical protein
MTYLIEPTVVKGPCVLKGCTSFCGIKPCYGVVIVPE